MMFSLTMLPPSASHGSTRNPRRRVRRLLLLIAGAGAALWFPVRRSRRDLRLRDGFVIVVAFWIALGITGSVPLLLSDTPELPLADAVFRVRLGPDHHRRDGRHRARRSPQGGALLPAPAAMAGRHGNHRPRSGNRSDARHRRNAAIPRGDPGTDEGLQADTAHHRNRQGALVPVPSSDGDVRPRLLDGGDGSCSTRFPTLFQPWQSAASRPTT